MRTVSACRGQHKWLVKLNQSLTICSSWVDWIRNQIGHGVKVTSAPNSAVDSTSHNDPGVLLHVSIVAFMLPSRGTFRGR